MRYESENDLLYRRSHHHPGGRPAAAAHGGGALVRGVLRLASAAIALVVGRAMTRLSKPTSQTFFAREGFVIVALAWVLMSLIGMLPFLFSG